MFIKLEKELFGEILSTSSYEKAVNMCKILGERNADFISYINNENNIFKKIKHFSSRKNGIYVVAGVPVFLAVLALGIELLWILTNVGNEVGISFLCLLADIFLIIMFGIFFYLWTDEKKSLLIPE